jgi:hypothetical protein
VLADAAGEHEGVDPAERDSHRRDRARDTVNEDVER